MNLGLPLDKGGRGDFVSDRLNIYHMDLYRLEDYSTWVSIGGEEIAQDSDSIMLIEWPEILDDSVTPTKKISIEVMEDGERKIRITIL